MTVTVKRSSSFNADFYCPSNLGCYSNFLKVDHYDEDSDEEPEEDDDSDVEEEEEEKKGRRGRKRKQVIESSESDEEPTPKRKKRERKNSQKSGMPAAKKVSTRDKGLGTKIFNRKMKTLKIGHLSSFLKADFGHS